MADEHPTPPGSDATAGTSAKGIRGALTRKVGPLPLWAWAVLAGGAVLAVRLYAGRQGGGGSQKVFVPTVAGAQTSTSTPATTGPARASAAAPDAPTLEAPAWLSEPPPWWRTPPIAPVTAPPVSSPTTPTATPALVTAPAAAANVVDTLVGKTASVASKIAPQLFTQTSPSTVVVKTATATTASKAATPVTTVSQPQPGPVQVVSPTNIIAGWFNPATGNLDTAPGPGKVAIFK